MTEEQLVAVLMPVCLEKRAALLCARLNKHEFEAVESAATKPLLERIAQKQSRIDQLIQEVAAGADAEASQRERIAELEAKLAQLVPDGWKLAPVKPTEAMVVQGAGIIDDNGGNARWSDMREAWDAMLAAAPAAPEQQDHSEQHLDMVAQASNAQQAEPPPWWPAVENILNEYGLQAVDFVADFKAAQQAEAQEPVAWANFTEDGNIRIWSKKPESANWCGLTLVPLFTRPQPAQHQLCQGERP